MLVPELKPYAAWLDERNYRVQLASRQDYYANLNFDAEDYFSSSWMNDYWQKVFKYKISVSGITLRQGMRVLDICCGRGELGSFLEHHFAVKVVYCDISLTQLINAAENKQLLHNPLQAACCADVLHLPFASGSFDMVIGNSFLHHIADIPGALAELRRVQAPSGATLLLHEPSTTAPFLQSFPQSLLGPVRRLLGKNKVVTPGFTDLWLFRPDDLQRLFVETGFRSIKLWDTGLISGLSLTLWMNIAYKLKWQSRSWVFPTYLVKALLDKIESRIPSQGMLKLSPSLMVLARD
jgi:ubiquinone/menaquinone biosynthesis C-methylase UbiE